MIYVKIKTQKEGEVKEIGEREERKREQERGREMETKKGLYIERES